MDELALTREKSEESSRSMNWKCTCSEARKNLVKTGWGKASVAAELGWVSDHTGSFKSCSGVWSAMDFNHGHDPKAPAFKRLLKWYWKRGWRGLEWWQHCSILIVTQKSAEKCLGLVCIADDNCGENCSTRHVVSHLLPTFANWQLKYCLMLVSTEPLLAITILHYLSNRSQWLP